MAGSTDNRKGGCAMTLRLVLSCPTCKASLFTLWPDWGFWHCKACGFYAKLSIVKNLEQKKLWGVVA